MGIEDEESVLLQVGHRRTSHSVMCDLHEKALEHSKKNNISGIIVGEWGAGKSQFMRSFSALVNRGATLTYGDSSGGKEKAFSLENCIAVKMKLRKALKCEGDGLVEKVFHRACEILGGGLVQEVKKEKGYPGGYSKKERTQLKKMLKSFDPIAFVEKLDRRHVFLYVDELEELTDEEESVRNFVTSEIKDFVDNNIDFLQENPEVKIVTLLFGCADDIWQKLSREVGVEWGGVKSRITRFFIPLRRLKPEEVHEMIKLESNKVYDLLTDGAVYSLFHASMGNPRNLIQLLDKIKDTVPKKKGKPKRSLGSKVVLPLLRRSEITLQNETLPCIHPEFIRNVTKSVSETGGEKHREVFELLVGEPYPCSRSEISKALSITEVEVGQILDMFGIEIPAVGRSVVRIWDSYDTTRETVSSMLHPSETVEKEGVMYLRRANIRLETVLDSLTFWKRDGGKGIQQEIFVPREHTEMASVLDIKKDLAEDIHMIFNRELKDEFVEKRYRLSNSVLQLIYPAPPTAYLPFIKVHRDRSEIMREIREIHARPIEANELLESAFQEIFSLMEG
ncbi:MAG: hypothetical protein V3V98_09910 [Thermoplasmata archaeon]